MANIRYEIIQDSSIDSFSLKLMLVDTFRLYLFVFFFEISFLIEEGKQLFLFKLVYVSRYLPFPEGIEIFSL